MRTANPKGPRTQSKMEMQTGFCEYSAVVIVHVFGQACHSEVLGALWNSSSNRKTEVVMLKTPATGGNW